MKAYLFLADGFETVEALAPLDVMRRAGINVVTVSIMKNLQVRSAQNVPVLADAMYSECSFADADALILPGGSEGTENLSAFESLHAELMRMNSEGRLIAAICAAPMVLGRIGLLQERVATWQQHQLRIGVLLWQSQSRTRLRGRRLLLYYHPLPRLSQCIVRPSGRPRIRGNTLPHALATVLYVRAP